MSIFKKSRPTKIVDDTETIVNDFNRRAPFWSYRTVNYREYEPFISYKREIDDHLDKIFKKEIDDGNGNILDNMICDMAMEAIEDLKRQRKEHGDTLKSFDIRAKGDKLAFEHELRELKEEFERTYTPRKNIIERLDKDKFEDKFIGGNEDE